MRSAEAGPPSASAPAHSSKRQSAPGQAAAPQTPASQAAGPAPSVFTTAELDDLLGLVTGNNTTEARKLGAKKLLEVGSPEAADRLVLVLRASVPDLAAQTAVCRAIANTDKPMPVLIEPLLRLLTSPHSDLVEAAVEALRRFDGAAVVERLRPLAVEDSIAPETRLAAINALGAMGERFQAVELLVKLTQEESSSVRSAALAALTRATGVEQTDPASAINWWRQRENMSEADWLTEIHERCVTQNNRLRAERTQMSARLVSAYREVYLHTLEADRPQKQLSFLTDELPEVRSLGLDLVNAAITDRKDTTAEIKARLAEMISDPDPALRLKVAQIIGDLRLTGVSSRLVESLSGEADHRVRAALVNAIGRLDGTAAVPALIERLNDDMPSVVAQSALALATIARSAESDDNATVPMVAGALAKRFAGLPMHEEEVREKFLDAMMRIGSESFRPIFKAEMAADSSVRVRRAAIAGLAAFGDMAAADDVVGLLSAAESEIRMAAAAAMGKCGRRESDLAALAPRLDAKGELEPTVRQRTWESYLAIAERLPPREHLRVAEQFDKPGDKIAQRRRLELLTALRTSAQRFEQLKSKSDDKRAELLEAMAGAHAALGEFAAAASCLTQAVELIQDPASPRSAALTARSIAVLLAGHEDETALQRLKELTKADGGGDSPAGGPLLVESVVNELKARVAAVDDAATFADATRLIELMTPLAARLGPEFGRRLEGLREEALGKRSAAIDALLNSTTVDSATETRLLGFGLDVVLKRLHARLTAAPTATAPAPLSEERLIQLARRLAPDWPGYSPEDPPAKREAALNALKAMASSPPTSAPRPAASAPSP